MTKNGKQCFLLAVSLVPALLFAQGGPYIIKGKLSTLKIPAKIFLDYMINGNFKRDSAIVRNGQFEFKGSITESLSAWLTLKRKGAVDDPYAGYDGKEVYLEKGAITITGRDSIATATITGGPVNTAFQKMRAMQKPIGKQQDELSAMWARASVEQRELLKAKSISIGTEYKRLLASFVKENRNSVVSLRAIEIIVSYRGNLNDVEPVYKLLTSAVQQTEQGKYCAANIERLRAIGIGATAPSFVQNDTSGQPVKLANFRGKYVLIDFWASWCGPCREDNPGLVKIYNKYKDKNFTIVGISVDTEERKAAWLAAIKEDGLPWTHVSDLKMRNEAAETYYVRGVPQNFLIDPQGTIIAKDLHGEDLEKKLAALLDKE